MGFNSGFKGLISECELHTEDISKEFYVVFSGQLQNSKENLTYIEISINYVLCRDVGWILIAQNRGVQLAII